MPSCLSGSVRASTATALSVRRRGRTLSTFGTFEHHPDPPRRSAVTQTPHLPNVQRLFADGRAARRRVDLTRGPGSTISQQSAFDPGTKARTPGMLYRHRRPSRGAEGSSRLGRGTGLRRVAVGVGDGAGADTSRVTRPRWVCSRGHRMGVEVIPRARRLRPCRGVSASGEQRPDLTPSRPR
jgi:hypothetical protein